MNSDTQPKVTVIIPLYNKERYIAETLESLLSQSFTAWEAIVVDDGSTDRSIPITAGYSQKDKRIRLLHREGSRKGGSVCRNIGLRQAKGEFVLFLDADDLLMPYALEQRVKRIEAEAVDFVVYPVGHFVRTIGDDSLVKRIDSDIDPLTEFLSYRIPWHTTSPIWRIGFLRELGGFDEAYPRLQDVELHTRALLTGGRYTVGNRLDFYHRIDAERRAIEPEEKAETMVASFLLYLEKMTRYIEQSPRRKDPTLQAALVEGLIKLVDKVVYEPVGIGKKSKLLRMIGRSEAYRRIAADRYVRRRLRSRALYGYLRFLKRKFHRRG